MEIYDSYGTYLGKVVVSVRSIIQSNDVEVHEGRQVDCHFIPADEQVNFVAHPAGWQVRRVYTS